MICAVVGLTKAAALQYAKAGIRINVVAPAAIETDISDCLSSWRTEKDDEPKQRDLRVRHCRWRFRWTQCGTTFRQKSPSRVSLRQRESA
ncbi:SDR family oxidoreductase [Microcoleus sp. Pol11C2]|uniref:SDR family oxidoreductase n=1 Tax=Microcoleus sp. Pol11C2 TaxID=3055389 RepID=UPI002FD266F4